MIGWFSNEHKSMLDVTYPVSFLVISSSINITCLKMSQKRALSTADRMKIGRDIGRTDATSIVTV